MGLPAGRDGVNAVWGRASGAPLAPQLDLLLAAGGGREIWPDPANGRNAFGATVRPAGHEIWFSSTSAQSIGPRAWDETLGALARLTRAPTVPAQSLSAWFDDIRLEIAHAFGAPGACVLLAGDAAQARDYARAIARALLRRPVVEIVTSPAEATQFLLGPMCAEATLVVELRTTDGDPREQTDIDADALQLTEAALESSAGVLLHLLDTSKTGLRGVSRGVARAVQRAAAGHALALVDASEGRIVGNEVRGDLAHGMMVLVSGSQFIGGPPFSAALLLPPGIVEALLAFQTFPGPWPAGARHDAPRELRNLMSPGFTATANPGLGLRWTAALAEMHDYARIDETLRREILEVFSRTARALAACRAFLTVESPPLDDCDDPLRASIVPLIPLTPRGPRPALEYARAIHAALARPCAGLTGDAICHVGAPVPVGDRAALTLAASAPMVSAVARRIAMGLSFERAISPVLRDIETLFRKWEALAG